MRSTTLSLAVGVASIALLAACSSGGSSGGSSSSSSASGSSSGGGGASCTKESLQSALPNGSEISKFTCADVAGTEWAAVKVSAGNTVFFLQKKGDAWNASTAQEICGTASAGLPQQILDYCNG